MQIVQSFEQLHTLPAEIRSKRNGFITNFYLDEAKHTMWIEKGVFFYDWYENTLFLIKKSTHFWNVFYCTTTTDDFSIDLDEFQSRHSETTMIFDIVGRQAQCSTLVELFNKSGFIVAASLVRMIRMTTPMAYTPDNTVRSATQAEVSNIHNLLFQYFNEKTEQIPFKEELETYTKEGRIFVCEENGCLAGFLIYEINTTTLYLRYWFTHPDFRDRKVGSRLLRRFFEAGKDTKRQLFWVMLNNDNTVKRYKHYGFKEEDMFDYVLTNNKI